MVRPPYSDSILNIIYPNLDPYDWEGGLDIYQAGKVKEINDYGDLVSGVIENLGPSGFRARLKLHNDGQVIQWYECSCMKNRKYGLLCEHLIALLVHIDREIPGIFKNLDKRFPIKLPKTKKSAKISEIDQTTNIPKNDNNASSDFLDRGTIISVKAGKHPGSITIKFEIKRGLIDSLDMNIDQAVAFLKTKKHKQSFNMKAKSLNIMSEVAFPATKLDSIEDVVKIERIIAIRKTDDLVEKINFNGKLKPSIESLVDYDRQDKPEIKYITFPFKKLERHFGREYLFIPEVGYFKYDSANLSGNWYDMPYSRKLKNTEISDLIDSDFENLICSSKVLGPSSLKKSAVLMPKINNIEFKQHEHGWFFLDPEYKSGDFSISMKELVHHVQTKKNKYIQSRGRWIKIPDLIRDFQWNIDNNQDCIKLDTLGMLRLKASLSGDESIKRNIDTINEAIKNTTVIQESPPPGLPATKISLRNYQEEGHSWLWWLYQNNIHGLLADDMGLGKTHQTMALLASIQSKYQTKKTQNAMTPKFLVICPTTVLEHWESKVIEFAPKLKPLKFHGPKRNSTLKFISDSHHTLITSYGVVLRDIKQLSKIDWEVLVLDEAHLIKNRRSETYKSVSKLKSRMRLCLTGTPIENNLLELKALYDFLVPGYLGTDDYFKKSFLKPIDGDDEGLKEKKKRQLLTFINPLKMRRTKSQVLNDLPEKIEDKRYCSLSEEQVALYRQTVSLRSNPLINKLQENDTSIPYMHVLATLQVLKQICNHPSLITGRQWSGQQSGKFELLQEILNEAFRSDHKVVIFTQYIGMITIISEYLKSIDKDHVILNGSTKSRGQVIAKFQTDPKCKVFIGSLLAGGIGIDLTAASVVIHYDRWWNASKENQATDRVYRIGQKRSVQVIKMVTKGTLEEKIDQMITNKMKLFDQYMAKDEELFKKLSKQELIELLSG